MKKTLSLAASAAILLASCAEEDITRQSNLPGDNDLTPIQISAYTQQATRAYNARTATITSLSNSGGGFTVRAVNTTDNSAVIDGWTYNASPDGTCTPGNASLMAYWPSDDSNVNFFAHYPADGNTSSATFTTNVTAGTMSFATDGTKDVMGAYKQAKVSDGSSVALSFKHLTAKTIIKVTCDNSGLPDGAQFVLTKFTLNAPVSATYDFINDTVMANAAVADTDFEFVTNADEYVELSATTATAIDSVMLAVSSGAGIICPITVGYTVKVNATTTRPYTKTGEVTLVAGYLNQLNITVSCDKPIAINAALGGWTTSGEAQDAELVDFKVYEYVDLDLPSKILWATCNVGANNPEEYGDYIAWGETTPHYSVSGADTTWLEGYSEGYNWITYKYCGGTQTDGISSSTLTKYCNNSSNGKNGYTDNLTVLEDEDDAAAANWGSGWRMPTQAEWEELVNSSYTKMEWTTLNGVDGYKITSLSNGNYIFLPAAGNRFFSGITDPGVRGYYWSSSLYGSNPSHAWSLDFFSTYMDYVKVDYYYRYYGFCVRAVRSGN